MGGILPSAWPLEQASRCSQYAGVQNFIPATVHGLGGGPGLGTISGQPGPAPHGKMWRNRSIAGRASPTKMKKAFWEPPKKPFCKMFVRRKVISSKAGVVPKVGLLGQNKIIKPI